jgi:hypothetical protein
MNKKRSSLIVLALLCLTLLASVGILPVSASETVSQTNLAKYKAVRDELDAEVQAYLTLDTTAEKRVFHKTNAVISDYSKQVIDLSSAPEAQTTDLTAQFDLLLAKGKLVGKISWIANLHTNGSPNESILAKHSELRAKIDAKTSLEDLANGSEFSDRVCIEMNRAVFRELIHAQARNDDSENTSDILNNGVEKIELCSYTKIDGAEFLLIYNEVMRVVSLQRGRDGAAEELQKVYVIIKGSDEGFLEDPSVKAFFAAVDGNVHVDESLSAKDINDALIRAAKEILDDEIPSPNKYVFSYREGLKKQFEKDAALATDMGVFAPISKNLANHEIDLYRAQTKDKVASLILPSETNTDLLGLISEYTDDGGILDRCSAAIAMDEEHSRASFRILWYRDYAACKQSVENILYIHAKDISNRLTSYAKENIYLIIDGEITNVDMSKSNAEEVLNALRKKGRLSLEDLLCDAKAERFCIDHKTILEDTDISENDRVLLERAMSEYDSILKNDLLTAEKLNAKKQALNDKYKALIQLCINTKATGEDASVIINALNALSSDLAPYSLKLLADDHLLRAEALGVLQKKYASVTSDSRFYQSYDSESKTALATDYRTAANAMISSSAGELSLPKVLENINAEAELSMEIHDAIARVRLAAKGCSLSEIKKTVEDAEKAISSESDIEKIHLLRDNAVFRIECQKKGDEMRASVSALKSEIDGLRALNSASKTVLKGEADLLLAYCNMAANAADKTSLDNIVNDFESKRSALKSKAESAALAEGKRQFIEEIKKKVSDTKGEINGYSFINYTVKNASDEYLSKLDAISKSFENNASDNSTGWNELDILKALALEDIGKTLSDAYTAECVGARASASDSIKAAFTMPDHYSKENREKIEKIISDSISALNGASTVERILELRDAAISDIGKVYDLLDEAKEAALKKTDELYLSLKKNADCYSEEIWAEVQELYEHTRAEISQISVFEDRDKADVIASECCALMKAKRRDKINTQAQITIQGPVYPNGFDTSANGFAATLSAKGQILSDATFSVFPFSNENAVNLIRSAVKRGNVTLPNGTTANKALIKTLRGANVLVGLNMEYSASDTAINGMYSISLLLPDTLNTDDILGVVYIRSSGSIEYFECKVDQRVISFDIPHFSSFYIITEKTVDLTPLIVILSMILVIEIAIIALLILRRKKARTETSLSSFVPFLPIAALAKITPSGAVPAAVILGLLVICAGGVIAWLVSEEITQRRKVQKKQKATVQALPDPTPVPAIQKPKSTPSEISQLSAPSSDTEKDIENNIEKNSEDIAETKLSDILPNPDTVIVLDTVTAEEANDLMSDADAKASLKEISSDTVSYASYASHGKKHEVNIDVISAAFLPNETVSLDALKKKGLVSRSAKAVKILARGTLDKPLTVIAQDFSTAAVKMITLTGGRAMIVERE